MAEPPRRRVDFWRLSGEEFNDAEDAQKIGATDEALRGVWAALYVAEKMGESVGRGEVLLGCVPDAETGRRPWVRLAQARVIGSGSARLTRGRLLGPPRGRDVDGLGSARHERLMLYE